MGERTEEVKILLKVLFWVVLYGVVIIGGSAILNKVDPSMTVWGYICTVTAVIVGGCVLAAVVVAFIHLWDWIDSL